MYEGVSRKPLAETITNYDVLLNSPEAKPTTGNVAGIVERTVAEKMLTTLGIDCLESEELFLYLINKMIGRTKRRLAFEELTESDWETLNHLYNGQKLLKEKVVQAFRQAERDGLACPQSFREKISAVSVMYMPRIEDFGGGVTTSKPACLIVRLTTESGYYFTIRRIPTGAGGRIPEKIEATEKSFADAVGENISVIFRKGMRGKDFVSGSSESLPKHLRRINMSEIMEKAAA